MIIRGKRYIKGGEYNKFHKENLVKYDKNNDGLITLKEYLAEEISKGPKAKPKSINYNYQDYHNIFNYFYILLEKKSKFKILCLPNFTLKYYNYAIRTALSYNFKDDELIIAPKMLKSINKCLDEKSTRFIFYMYITTKKCSIKSCKYSYHRCI